MEAITEFLRDPPIWGTVVLIVAGSRASVISSSNCHAVPRPMPVPGSMTRIASIISSLSINARLRAEGS